MATSQNGWVVRTSSSGLAPLSWITGRVLPGDVFTIFDFLCTKFNATVEPIRRDQSWGWAYRVVRGGSDLSNHASATAIDLNAPSHPLGYRGTFSPDQNRAIQRILNDLDAVVRWGGDYPGRPDEMHFEINASAQRVAAVADRIRKGTAGGGGPAPTPGGGGSSAPTPTPEEEDDMPTAAEVANAVLNTPDPALGGKTVHQVLAGLAPVRADVATVHASVLATQDLFTPGKTGVKFDGDIYKRITGTQADIATVHASVLATPQATASTILNTKVKRAGSATGETSLAAVLAWYDDHILRLLGDQVTAGGSIDMAQVTAAIKTAADAALADIEITRAPKTEASK